MKKLNILYLGNLQLPNKNAAASRVINNAKAIKTLGHSVYILGLSSKKSEVSTSWHKIDKQIHYYNYYAKKRFKIFSLKILKSQIETLKIDIVIAYNLNSMTLFYLLLICKIMKIKIIGDITEWYSIKGYIFPINIIKGLDTFIRMRILNKYMEGLIVISDYLSNYYKKQMSVQIPPLVDLNDDFWLNSNIYKSVSSDFPVFSYIGNIGKGKDNLSVILNAFLNIKNHFKLYIVGVQIEDLKEIDLKLYLKCINEKNIIFHGKVDQKIAISLLFRSDYSLIIRNPSRMNNAGFPTKFVEAVTSNTQIIATNVSDIYKYKKIVTGVYIVDSLDLVKSITEIILDFSVANHREKRTIKLNDTFDYRNYVHLFQYLISNLN